MSIIRPFAMGLVGAVFILFPWLFPAAAGAGGGMGKSPLDEPGVEAGAGHEHEDGKLFCVLSSGVCPLPTGETADESHLKAWKEMDDPNKDGWVTEEFHELAKKQLKKLGKL
ncbi:MAG: hypothetical protein GY859_29215, partial [Desulfobacterales bacterium]|nr:hypothetical protein [Desulfobacterales bacterium]